MSAGKSQRNASGRKNRDPDTGKTRRNTGSITTCCCGEPIIDPGPCAPNSSLWASEYVLSVNLFQPVGGCAGCGVTGIIGPLGFASAPNDYGTGSLGATAGRYGVYIRRGTTLPLASNCDGSGSISGCWIMGATCTLGGDCPPGTTSCICDRLLWVGVKTGGATPAGRYYRMTGTSSSGACTGYPLGGQLTTVPYVDVS